MRFYAKIKNLNRTVSIQGLSSKQPEEIIVRDENQQKLKSPDKRDFITNNKQIPSLAMQVSEGIPFLLSVVVRPEKNLDSFSSVILVEFLLD